MSDTARFTDSELLCVMAARRLADGVVVFASPPPGRSEPSMTWVGRNGIPIAAARKRRPIPRWLHSSKRTSPRST